jgi:hypothetical protein
MHKGVPVLDSLRQGWDLTFSHAGSVALLVIAYAALTLAGSAPSYFISESGMPGYVVLTALETLWGWWLLSGAMLYLLYLYRDGRADISLVVSGLPYLLHYVLVQIGMAAFSFFAFLPGAAVLLAYILLWGPGFGGFFAFAQAPSVNGWFELVAMQGGS